MRFECINRCVVAYCGRHTHVSLKEACVFFEVLSLIVSGLESRSAHVSSDEECV